MHESNEPLSALTHLIGVFLSIAALVIMIVFATGTSKVVGVSIFGSTLILLYLASTLFHIIPKKYKNAKKVFERIDHSMIYFLIAGTYTPILLVPLSGAWGWSLFGIVWTIALAGSILKMFTNMNVTFSTILYVVMGWIITVALKPLLAVVSIPGFIWLLFGGISYTVGAIFFSIDNLVPRTKWFGMHEIFHIFVMIGSFAHFWFMLNYI